MKKQFLIIGLLVGILVGSGFSVYRMYGIGASKVNEDSLVLVSQVSNVGGVTVTITPRSLPADAQFWEFDVVLSTHVQELGGYDLAQLATLVDAQGTVLRPISWVPDAASGHHIGGVLRFPRTNTDVLGRVVVLSGVTSDEVRVFRWTP